MKRENFTLLAAFVITAVTWLVAVTTYKFRKPDFVVIDSNRVVTEAISQTLKADASEAQQKQFAAEIDSIVRSHIERIEKEEKKVVFAKKCVVSSSDDRTEDILSEIKAMISESKKIDRSRNEK